MSSTEKMFFWVFRTHYNSELSSELAKGFSLDRLNGEVRAKMLHVLSVIGKLRLGEGDFAHGDDATDDDGP
jgi:hypothetical protein